MAKNSLYPANHLVSPHRMHRLHGRLSPWFDAKCRSHPAWVSPTWTNTQLGWQPVGCGSTQAVVGSTSHRRKKEESNSCVVACGRSSSTLWRSMSSLLERDGTCRAPPSIQPMDSHRSSSGHASQPPPPGPRDVIASFRSCREAEFRRIVMSSPVKFSAFNPYYLQGTRVYRRLVAIPGWLKAAHG